mgnify:CR=1 FL=1
MKLFQIVSLVSIAAADGHADPYITAWSGGPSYDITSTEASVLTFDVKVPADMIICFILNKDGGKILDLLCFGNDAKGKKGGVYTDLFTPISGGKPTVDKT